MKALLPLLKANLISVISVAVAIIAAPVMLYFGRSWENKVHAEVESEVSNHLQQLSSSDVTYSVEPYLSGQQPVSVKAPPNQPTTNAVVALLQGVVAGSEEVRRKAIEFNKRDKPLLITGPTPADNLFPDNKDESTRLKLLEQMVERWPKAHADLLREFRVGLPPDAARVRTDLEALRTKEIARLTTGRTEAALSPEQRTQLQQLLGKSRLEIYRQGATELAYYGAPSMFTAVQPFDRTKSSVLPMETAWEWQHLYWIHRDVIRALTLANSDLLGAARPVYLGPVKIVESITVTRPGEKAGSASGSSTPDDGRSAGGGGGGSPDGSVEVPRNFTLSHTGRAAAPPVPNPLYDIRYVDIVMVVSASRLPQVLAAFPRVNFMTVVDVDIEEFDPMPALAAGFDLGSEHVVRATIRLETIWLRSWMKQWMPPVVRKSLGIPDDPSPTGSEGGTAPESPEN